MAKKILTYEHNEKRSNIPQIGLVNESTDPEYGQNKKTYKYDMHLDPELSWDSSKVRDECLDKIESLAAQIAQHEENIRKIEEQFGAAAKEIVDSLRAQHKDMLALLEDLKAASCPTLKWTGKAERTSFEVPTVSLHIHERIDPKTILEAVKKETADDTQLSLFEEKKPLREAIDFYKHRENWSNRLIAGDSLLVMHSLLEKEGMGGKVQMVYFDPPYGIKYGSNFQPFVNKREVKDGSDEDLTQEPEMIKAFRDTWELGIHSYLTYLRDRLLLVRELLHESGSVFVQISDDNSHHLKEIMDEVFLSKNFVSQIVFTKTAGGLESTKRISTRFDYLLWYTKDFSKLKYHVLFEKHNDLFSVGYNQLLFPDFSYRSLNKLEKENNELIPKDAKLFLSADLTKPGPGSKYDFEFNGKKYDSGNRWWGIPKESLEKLKKLGRIITTGNKLRFVKFSDDFPYKQIDNLWNGYGGASNPMYVVQTNQAIIQRCLLMTTDPGDLVLDITCGSGTTAYVAEQWGRRWITCDTSRIALTLAKQRLMTAVYDYYQLARPNEGISGGFKYKTVPHVTLKSIANNEPAEEETLYDQPYSDKSKTRVTGPFTVESVPTQIVKSLEETVETGAADNSISRSGETLRQNQWKDELLRTGVRAKGGVLLEFSRLDTLSGTKYLQAEGESKGEKPEKVIVVFGPEHAAMDARQVELAMAEAKFLKPNILLFCAFQFDEAAAKDIDEMPEAIVGFKLLKAQMNMDLQTEDLKKKASSNQSFWLIGQPDVQLQRLEDGNIQVEVVGWDYYNPRTGKVDSGGKKNIAMWMLDTDYDGRSIFPKQIFFPIAGDKEGWTRLAKNLKAEIDEAKMEAFSGTISLPFKAGTQIAVKIIDDRGIESLKVITV
jgi:adenine-specific DNA-methyltransferase